MIMEVTENFDFSTCTNILDEKYETQEIILKWIELLILAKKRILTSIMKQFSICIGYIFCSGIK